MLWLDNMLDFEPYGSLHPMDPIRASAIEVEPGFNSNKAAGPSKLHAFMPSELITINRVLTIDGTIRDK